MAGTTEFGLIVAVIGLAGTAAVLSNRLSARLRVPAPAFFLVAAVIAAQLWPQASLSSAGTVLPAATVKHVDVTVALAIILFDGGMHIGRQRVPAPRPPPSSGPGSRARSFAAAETTVAAH